MIAEILIAILFAGCGLFYIACIWATLDFFKPWQRKKIISIHNCAVMSASVSLMVPICGLDDRAARNWEAFCQQIDCGPYEVLFGIADPQDLAIPILQGIQATYPDRVRLFIDLPPRGANYKDSTLSYLLEAADYEWLIFADSDISVTPHYIWQVMYPLVHHHADVITCAFIGRQPKTLTSAIASLNRCCDFIPSALIARKLDGGLRFAIGMTIALHRDTLEQVGGLHLDRIGSDYNLGKRCAQAGAKIELLSSVLESDTGNENLYQLYTRELRWSRTIRFNKGNTYYTMLFCFGSVYALILMIVSLHYPEIPLWMQRVSFGLVILRYLQAAIACWTMDASPLMAWFPLLLVRDCISFVTWLIGCWGNHIVWRGRHLKIEPDGIVTEITS
jgi:ceramide glucosyltransferase